MVIVLFFVIAALMIAAALAFVLVPMLRRRAQDPNVAKRAALDAARAAGVIDESEYATKLADIGPAAPAAATAPRQSVVATALAVALLLPAGTLLLYRAVGTPQALAPAATEGATGAGEHGASVDAAIRGLAARLQQQPGDVEGWTLLARAYGATGRPAQAREAFGKALQLAPDNAELHVEYGQFLAESDPQHRIAGEALAQIETALKQDPDNQRALWLRGASQFQTNDFAAAAATWRHLLTVLKPDADVVPAIRKQIADADARAKGEPLPPAAAANAGAGSVAPTGSASPAIPAPSAAGAAGTSAAVATARASTAGSDPAQSSAANPGLTVHVSLAPSLARDVTPGAILFVYARAVSGPPMPLAIKRLEASDLPATVTLADADGVMPTMRLSSAHQVVVAARVSASGNAMPQSGDLEGESAPIDLPHGAAVDVTIARAVP